VRCFREVINDRTRDANAGAAASNSAQLANVVRYRLVLKFTHGENRPRRFKNRIGHAPILPGFRTQSRAVFDTTPAWNYTTILDIALLVLMALLAWRFFTTGASI